MKKAAVPRPLGVSERTVWRGITDRDPDREYQPHTFGALDVAGGRRIARSWRLPTWEGERAPPAFRTGQDAQHRHDCARYGTDHVDRLPRRSWPFPLWVLSSDGQLLALIVRGNRALIGGPRRYTTPQREEGKQENGDQGSPIVNRPIKRSRLSVKPASVNLPSQDDRSRSHVQLSRIGIAVAKRDSEDAKLHWTGRRLRQ